jgi:hypothetical protein
MVNLKGGLSELSQTLQLKMHRYLFLQFTGIESPFLMSTARTSLAQSIFSPAPFQRGQSATKGLINSTIRALEPCR